MSNVRLIGNAGLCTLVEALGRLEDLEDLYLAATPGLANVTAYKIAEMMKTRKALSLSNSFDSY